MTLRDRASGIPEVLVIAGSRDDATALGRLAGEHDGVLATLVATGPDPMAVDEVLDDLGTPAGRILLPGPGDPPPDVAVPVAVELAGLLPRIDEMIGAGDVAAVVVHGGTTAALAAAQVAVWRRVPVVAVPGPVSCREHAAHRAAIAELAAWQAPDPGGVPLPAWLDLLVARRLAASVPAQRVVEMPTTGRPNRPPRPGLSA